MATQKQSYIRIGNEEVLSIPYSSGLKLTSYNPLKGEDNQITSTGLAAHKLNGSKANRVELGHLLEMDVMKRLLDYKQAELGEELIAIRSEKGKDVVSNSVIAELDVSLFSKDLDYMLRCQVKHRSANSGKTELFDFIGSALMMTNAMVDPDGILEPGEISDFNSVKKMDLYFVANSGNPFEDGFSVSPRARFYIDVLFKEAISDRRKQRPLPKNWKIEWLNDQRLQLRYWGKKKGNRMVGDPEIFLPESAKDREAYLQMRREARDIESVLLHDGDQSPLAPMGDALSWVFSGSLSDKVYQSVQRRWAVAEYSQIMGLMDIVDDLIIRASVNDRCGIDRALFEERLSRVDNALDDMEKGIYTSLPKIVRLLSSSVPSLYDSRKHPAERRSKQVSESEIDRMAHDLYSMVLLIQDRFDRRAIERGLMPYCDDKLRFRIVENERYAYAPPGLYLKR